MNAHKVTITFSEDGKLELTGLPFNAGDTVEIIFLEQPKQQPSSQTSSPEYPLHGKQHYRYDAPFEPAVKAEDWEVLK
ncbi:hypothetical protein [Oscillatoria sp. HE19RPO]|uniref:hypothetical protein n=1 Tax=Oscillatoria sp. HE19RPO TaxID=2954806 RepID=UPI0020C3536E|nr:hypothetical protein [Oscillatoria sp. HE19RPO]